MKVVLIRDGFTELTPRTAAKTRGSHEAWRRGEGLRTSEDLNRSHGERVTVDNRKRSSTQNKKCNNDS
ncbi:hypothetical protein [Furfurilactobacillus rossiae]|uniref:hypothetical protein n=1 Tax=Furfurilactobacillus rossiae TaxID=231049 RepID=UPI00036525A9|nr:hypothetical protein [Furfurilactobacillus rossiae]